MSHKLAWLAWAVVFVLSARADATPVSSAPEAGPSSAPEAGPSSAPEDGPSSETEAAAAEPPDDAEVIVVESRWPGVDLIDAADTSRATVVRAPSDTRTAATLGDHLAGAPGIAVQRTGPGQGAPIVRGLLGSAVLVLVDGIRLNNAIFRPAPNQYTSLVDPWNVGSVTVVKGPGSAAFGSDALGGVIDVATELPVFVGQKWQTTRSVALGVSSADRAAMGHAAFAVGRAGIGARGGVTIEEHQDLRNGDGVRQDPSAYRAYGGHLTAHWDRGHTATTAWLSFYEQPELPRTDELRPGFGQDEPAAVVWAYRPSRRVLVHVRELRRGLWGLDGLELHAAYQRIDDHRRIRDTGDPIELREEIVDHSVSALARAAKTAAGIEWLGGFDATHDVVACARVELDTTTGATTPAGCRFPDGSTMSQLGAFVEARRDLGSRVAARAGLRAGASQLAIAGADGATVDTADWAAELGVEARLSSTVSALLNAGRGFRAPNVNDLAGLGPRPGNRYQEPAERLRDERALGADVGVRAKREHLTAEAYVFALRHDERIDVVPTGRMTDSGREIVVSDNVGTTTTYGAELATAVHLSDRVAFDAALSWVRGDKDDLGEGEEPADRVPPWGGRLAVRWLPISRLALDADVRFAGAQRRLSQRDKEDPRIDPTGTDAHAIFSVGARYQWPEVSLSLRVENLADAQVREHGSGVDAPGIDARLLLQWRGGS